MKIMKRIVVYIHGKSVSAGEAKFYETVLKGYDVTGFYCKSLTPWNAKDEFLNFSSRCAVNIICRQDRSKLDSHAERRVLVSH